MNHHLIQWPRLKPMLALQALGQSLPKAQRLGCKSLMALEVAKQGQPGGGALITQDGQGLSITDAVVEHPAAAAQTPLEVQQMQPLAWPGAYIVAFWHWPRHS